MNADYRLELKAVGPTACEHDEEASLANVEATIRAHAGSILMLCRRLLNDDALAERATIETFVGLDAQTTSMPREQLERTAVRAAWHLSAESSVSSSPAELLPAGPSQAGPSKVSLLRTCRARIAELSTEQRFIVILRDTKGWSIPAIADLLRIAPDQARLALGAGRRALRDAIVRNMRPLGS